MSTALEMPTDQKRLPRGEHAALAARLASFLSPQTVVRADEPMARRTTLRVGGPADVYAEPVSETELALLLEFCATHEMPWRILGRGSNLLVRDGGIPGLVISLSQPSFSKIEVQGQRLHCSAGALLKNVANEARRCALGGLEFLEGIPGSLGGALRMNAGAMGGWVFDVVEAVRFMDRSGTIHEKPKSGVPFQYRGCPLLVENIALGAVLRGESAPREEIERKMAAYAQKRWSSQPRMPSAGCMFKNPTAVPAGRLIEELGLKGTRVGGAMISEVHGNFIVNDGAATASDILSAIALVQDHARTERGIELETEVEIVGED